jgi:hypothetical protein
MRLMLILKLLVPAIVLSAAATLPAVAGPKESALLASFAGDWRGKGKVTGPDPGTVVCRLSFKAATAGKLSYTGRCSFGTGAPSFRGTILYNEARKRFEAYSSAQGASSNVVGKKQRGGVAFSASGIETRYGTASSVMTLIGNAINLSFKLVDKKGKVTASSVVFGKN